MKLHHYTSLSTLRKILQTRKLKLNRLDNVDDLMEGETSDFGSFQKMCFVSCWTIEEAESIPMWSMYTKKDEAIRISMEYPFIKTHSIIGNPKKGIFGNNANSILPFNKIAGHGYRVLNFTVDKLLIPIEYTEDPSKINMKIIKKFQLNGSKYNLTLNILELGKYKSRNWEFQKEYRLRLLIIPMPPPPDDGNYVSKKYGEKCVEYFQEKIFGDRETYIENIFLDIAEKKFEAMQITIGPMVDDSKRKEIKDLCALNGIENIVDSILKNKIRL